MERKMHIAGYAAAITGSSVLYLALLWRLRRVPLCMLHHLTGLHCLFCGGTRAAFSLARGDLTGAAAMNPILILLVPAAGLFLLRPVWLEKKWVLWGMLGVFLAYSIARNIPWWPFEMLAPC